MLFALSTCVWCKKTKRLLDGLDISYEFIYVNELSGKDKAEVTKEMKKFNPHLTFPTIVVDGDKVIMGFKEGQIMRALS
jgi:glutaredoxin